MKKLIVFIVLICPSLMAKQITHVRVLDPQVKFIHIMPYSRTALREGWGAIAESPATTLAAQLGWPKGRYALPEPIDIQPKGAGGFGATVLLQTNKAQREYDAEEISKLPNDLTLVISTKGFPALGAK